MLSNVIILYPYLVSQEVNLTFAFNSYPCTFAVMKCLVCAAAKAAWGGAAEEVAGQERLVGS